MGFNRFHLRLILQVAAIVAAIYAVFYFLLVRQQSNTAVAFALLSVLLTLQLIHHLNRTNRLLGNFLTYMRERDPSLSFSLPKAERNFRGLHDAMEHLIREFKENRIELEVQAQYLEAILDNVSTGILCFGEDGRILTLNRAALSCLSIPRVSNLSEVEEAVPEFVHAVRSLSSGTQGTLTLQRKGRVIRLMIQVSRIRLKEDWVLICAFNDIGLQLEEQEIRSWKKLIRVINHEIMNSMTPIITLALAIRKKLQGKTGGGEDRDPEAVKDALRSASIIEERSGGLIQFIEQYKKLTGLPPARIERISANDLFARLEGLLEADLRAEGIGLEIRCPRSLHLQADPNLMDQVLINLVKNAREALKNRKDGLIRLQGRKENNGVVLCVEDNGEGIPPDRLEQVFVPFFSTRDEGSGIGLSLCRQIVRLHGGEIRVDSEPGRGTRVCLWLP
ncbi:MAG: ATP-binding protein [Bacteroidales bacterium]